MAQSDETDTKVSFINANQQHNNAIPSTGEADLLTAEEGKDARLLKHQKEIRCICKYIMITIFAIFCIALIIVFILLPVIFANSVELQRLLMFTNIGLPDKSSDYKTLPKHPHVIFRNFYLSAKGDSANTSVHLGVWHLPPSSLYPNESQSADPIDFDALLRNNSADVVVYFHGSGECRMDSVMMYKVLLRFFHVIAFDYRGYGDSSTGFMTEATIAMDAIEIFKWIRERTTRNIYVWGHSLGTPLGTLTIGKLTAELKPHGLILEAPLTSMHDEIPVHPYGKLFAWLPWFKQTVQNPLQKNGFLFATDSYVMDVECPIMILHAEDDSIIPYTLGRKLAEIAARDRPAEAGSVTYVQFSAKYRFDHFRIHQSKRLLTLIPNFTETCDKYFNKTENFTDPRERLRTFIL